MINSRIKELRESLHLSQEAFGKSIGLSKSGISNIERGIRTVRDSYVELICSKYNVSKEWLLTGNELAKEVHSLESFTSYLESLGYLVKVEVDEVIQAHQEDMDDDEGTVIGQAPVIDESSYIISISNDTAQAIFTEEEFKALQQQNRANIDGAILLQSQKNKKELPSAATESSPEDS